MSVEKAIGVAVLIGGAGLLYNEMNKPRIVAYNVTTHPGTTGNSGGPNMANFLKGIIGLFSGPRGGSNGPNVVPTPTPFNPQPKGGGPAPTSQTGQSASGNPLLALIGSIEAPKGYDQVYGGTVLQPPKPITQMTIRELYNWQNASVAAGSGSSAAGQYQVIRTTLKSLVDDGTVSWNDTYSPATQDRIGVSLLNRRGYQKWQRGAISDAQFGQNLSQEWASLPAVFKDQWGNAAKGQSYYSGDGLNHALTSNATVNGTLKALRAWL
jgi:muramidase (phage lysozyme)